MLELNRLMLKEVVGGDCECICIHYEYDNRDDFYEVNQGLVKDSDECYGICKASRYCNEDPLKDWECR